MAPIDFDALARTPTGTPSRRAALTGAGQHWEVPMDGSRLDVLALSLSVPGSRLGDRLASRRSALAALLGTTLLGSLPGATTARPRRGNRGKGKDKPRARAHAEKTGGGRSAPPEKKEVPHCSSPPPANLDLNDFYHISEQIVAEFCPQLNSGQQWRVPSRWFVSSQPYTPATTPDGFVPVADLPVDDFKAKFAALKYVVDPGTPQEQTTVFPNSDALFTLPLPQFNAVQVGPITLGKLQPLSVGQHEVELYWVFNAMHCDGFGTVVERSCVPGGEFLYTRFTFAVTPGHF